jgi:hypothetical protein
MNKRIIPLLLAPAACLAGCIYFTPATGLRLGDHSQEFSSSTPIGLKSYDGGNFTISYPAIWSVAATNQPAGGGGVTRVSIGAAFQEGGSEALTVTTLTPDTTASNPTQALGAFVESSLGGSPGFKLVSQGTATLSGASGNRLEATAQDKSGNATHLLAESAIFGSFAYVIVIETIESRFSALSPLFEQSFKSFMYKPGASPAPQTTASPTASASPPVTPVK